MGYGVPVCQAWSPDNNFIACVGGNKIIRILDR